MRSLRHAFTCVALLVLGVLALAPAASAAPAVTFKSTALPIPGFPGTGDILGAGTEVEVQSTITGTEYGGFPSPLVLLTINSPAGTKVNSNGFATCAQAVLEADGPQGCPKKSRAGPVGEGLGIVSFGRELQVLHHGHIQTALPQEVEPTYRSGIRKLFGLSRYAPPAWGWWIERSIASSAYCGSHELEWPRATRASTCSRGHLLPCRAEAFDVHEQRAPCDRPSTQRFSCVMIPDLDTLIRSS